MRWIQSIIILHLIAISKGRKLTEEENNQRLEQCGKRETNKIFNGGKVIPNRAPWAVVVSGPSHCSGSLISPRHVISATHCIADHTELEWTKTKLNYTFDREDCTENGHLIIPEIPASKVYIRNRNYEFIGRAKFVYFLNFCHILTKDEFQIQHPDDVMIIELSEDVEYASEVQPACLANSMEDSADGEILTLFGYGDNPKPGVKETPLKDKPENATLLSQEIDILPVNVEGTVNRMYPRIFKARSHGKNSIMCPGDSGGGAVSKINGRITVVGVAQRSTCVHLQRGENGEEIYGAVGFYAEEICDLTGICTPLEPDASKGIFNVSIFLIPIFFWFMKQ